MLNNCVFSTYRAITTSRIGSGRVLPITPLPGKPQTHCFGNCIEGRESRISVGGQCAVQAFALDSGGVSDLRNASRLRHAAQGDEENAWFRRILPERPEDIQHQTVGLCVSCEPSPRREKYLLYASFLFRPRLVIRQVFVCLRDISRLRALSPPQRSKTRA